MNARTQLAKNNRDRESVACPRGQAARPVGRIVSSAVAASFVAALLVLVPPASRATQLTLSNAPLFMSVPVESNIMHLLDDSGSMEWELMVSSANGGDGNGLPDIGGWYGNYYMLPSANNGLDLYYSPFHPYVVDSEAAVTGGWRARNSSFNTLYYNPAVIYRPWPGNDASGNPLYTNASPSSARVDPNNAAAGTLNLITNIGFWNYAPSISTTSYFYDTIYPAHHYTWTDSDSDGVVDASDTHALVTITSTTTSYTKASTRTDCAGSTCTYAEEIQNFANWFTYYRKRSYAAKNAIGSVITQGSGTRSGLQTYNGGLIRNAISLTSATNRLTLLQDLYGLNIYCTWTTGCPGTPARTALYSLGSLFEGASTPILSAASGGTCQQNFAVVVTDGFWNGAAPSLPGTGNTDADGNSPDAAGNTPYDGGAYADGYAYTLADVAMHFYERDLAPGLSNAVPVTAGVDENTKQHLVTYGVTFGVAGNLSANPPNKTDAFAWPAVAANTSSAIDDLRHAAFNGRGQFLNAGNPAELSQALQNAIGSIGDRTGSAAAVAVNSRNLTTGTRVYQVRFTSSEWSGDLRALALNASVDVETVVWSAKDQIKTQNWSTGRVILTRNDTLGIPFRWTTSGANALTTAQQNYLHDEPATTAVDNDGQGSARLEYLRGNSANEGAGYGYRTRTGGFKLGDIVNSAPTYIGTPPYLPDLETVTHSSFRTTYASRRAMVYVGANDGMLHGFDAATGQEKIAYVPSMLFSTLNQLANPNYVHRYYVDGPPVWGDVYGTFTNVSGVCATGCWRTVLTGGLGGGGKGIYALDITDPDGTAISGLAFNEANAAKIALWEYTDSSSNDMGYVFGKPNIVRVRTSASTTAWAVVFGNGYNSTNENAALYVVNAVTGALIRKVVLNPYAASTGNSNGLSTPAVLDTNSDYIADYVYAGDLRGNLWKVDLTSSNPASWDSSYKSGSTTKPLFQAVDGTTTTTVEQPITVRPEIGNHPDNLGGYMIYFGTGRYLTSGDNAAATSPVHTFYGVWDKSYTGSGTPVARADLLPQTISSATVGSRTVRGLTNTTMEWRTGASGTCQSDGTGNCLGCRVDLLTAQTGSLGEKLVANPLLLGGTVPKVLFNTLIPETDVCTAGGRGMKMAISPQNCGRTAEQIFDVDNDGQITSADMIDGTTPVAGVDPGIGILSEPTVIRDSATGTDISIDQGSSGDINTERLGGGVKGGRQSWRQLQ